jgi:hypothetical protein
MKFDFVYLGQTVLKYQVPLEVFVGLNEIYERQKKQLPKANKQLVGKIEDEVSLFTLVLTMIRCISIVFYHKIY